MNAIVTRKPVVDQIFGDNKAPLEEVLKSDFTDLQARIADLLLAAGNLPSRVDSDDDQAKVGKWIIDAKDLAHKVEETRTSEGRPILDAQRGINSFFKSVLAPLDEMQRVQQSGADDFVRRKAAAERAKAAREAEEDRRKAEEERLRAAQLKRPDAIGRAEGRAEAHDMAAEAAEERALASTADLTRTRAEGVTSSARAAWSWEFTDKDALYATLGPLGNFLTEAAVEAGINSMVRAHKARTALAGVRVFQKETANFRR